MGSAPIMEAQIFDFEKERNIREKLKLTRQTVAEFVEVDMSTLYRLEKFLTVTNDLDMMNNMAILYNCYLDDLVKDKFHLQ